MNLFFWVFIGCWIGVISSGRVFLTRTSWIHNFWSSHISVASAQSPGMVIENVLGDEKSPSSKIPKLPEKVDVLNLTPEDVKALESLISQRDQWEKEQASLENQKRNLQSLTISLEKKIQDLQQIYNRLVASTDMKSREEQKSLASLIKIYEHMKPSQAAQVFLKMEPRKVVDFIEGMREAKASAVLSELPAPLASYVTEQICQRRMIRDELQAQLEASRPSRIGTNLKQAA